MLLGCVTFLAWLIALSAVSSADTFCDVRRTGAYETGQWRMNVSCLSSVLDSLNSASDIRQTLKALGFSDAAINRRNSCFKESCFNIECSETEPTSFTWRNNSVVFQKLISLCWQWHPDSCFLVRLGFDEKSKPHFGQHSFHSLVNRYGGICSVGDSLLRQFHLDLLASGISSAQFSEAWVLVNMFNLRPMPPTELDRCESENSNLSFPKEYFLAGRAGTLPPSEYNCLPSKNQLERSNISSRMHNYLLHWQQWTRLLANCTGLLVLQTGHHWHVENPNGSLYPRMVESVLSYVERNFNGTVVYFPSFRGHNECSRYGSPQNPALGSSDKYQWLLPETLNHHWLSIAARMHGLKSRFFVLNTSASGILRPDAHRANAGGDQSSECLHYCTPGLTHSWTELLYNLLLQLSTPTRSSTSAFI